MEGDLRHARHPTTVRAGTGLDGPGAEPPQLLRKSERNNRIRRGDRQVLPSECFHRAAGYHGPDRTRCRGAGTRDVVSIWRWSASAAAMASDTLNRDISWPRCLLSPSTRCSKSITQTSGLPAKSSSRTRCSIELWLRLDSRTAPG